MRSTQILLTTMSKIEGARSRMDKGPDLRFKVVVTRLRWFVVALVVFVAAVTWTSDSITMQGERTVYTVGCEQGAWDGNRCTGHMVAGDRYRFRALKAHGEVLFWIMGSSEPSGRFVGCDVKDGRNWSCRAKADTPDAARTVTLEMVRGRPVRDDIGPTRPFHRVSKLTWILVDRGLWFGSTAAED